MATIGVDLGGTNIRAGLVEQGRLVCQHAKALTHKDSFDATLTQLTTLIGSCIQPSVKSIGIGVPSVVDVSRGIVYNVANIPSWEKVNLRDRLEDVFNLPVFINNDVNCFILGEHTFGQAKGFRSAVGLSIGTGLGAGVIIDNRLYSGSNCGAGEIGLLPYLDKNIESYAAGDFFVNQYQTTAKAMHVAALAGDAQALERWQAFGFHFGHAVKAVLYAYDPDVIVLGGSIAKAFGFFKAAMEAAMADFAYPNSLRRLTMFQSQNEAIALLGAATLVN